MPPAVGGGIRYTAEGSFDGVGCIPLPVPYLNLQKNLMSMSPGLLL